MEKLVHRKREAHQMLNVIWGIFTTLFLLLLLYLVWQYQQKEISYQIEKATATISEKMDNLISDIQQTVLSTEIDERNLKQCKKNLLPHLKLLVVNIPQITGVAILNNKQQVLCTTLPEKDTVTTGLLDSRSLALFGPIHLPDIDQSAFIIQQKLGENRIDIYLLQHEIEKLLTTQIPTAQVIALYDQQRHQVLFEMNRGVSYQHQWQMSPHDQQIINPILMERSSSPLFRHELIQLNHVEIIIAADQSEIARLALRFVIIAAAIILLVSITVYYYLRHLIHQHFSLHRAIRNSIKNNRFYPVYQPIMDRRIDTYCGAEVLLRWESDSHETIMPENFIEYAEQSGLIIPITIQIAKKVFVEFGPFLREKPNFHLAINFSSVHFTNPHFLPSFIDLCHKHDISPHQIMLEVTERDLLQNDLSLVSTMLKLREAGFSIAVDDFGTGNASISYLQHFPFNYLKIDRLFVNAIGTGAITESLNLSIIEMATRLGLQVIAEGVETYEQVNTLEKNGAFLMQGWYFSKGVRFEKFMHFIKRNS